MGRPDVNIAQGNGNLGRTAPAADGTALLFVTGIAVAGKFALGDRLGPFKSPADAEDMGIDAAYDTANTLLAYQHIVDFFAGAEFVGAKGTELYVVVVAAATTMVNVCDKTTTNAVKHLDELKGKVRLLCVTRLISPVGTLADQYPQDVIDAITKAQELWADQFAAPKHRPFHTILEGHNFQGNASTSKDFRTLAASRVTVWIGQDRDKAASNAAYNKYANAAFFTGILAGLPVQRDPGRVKTGALPIENAGLSSGVAINTVTDVNINSLHDHGAVFMLQHSGLDGYYINRFNTCSPLADNDYAYGTEGRVMDKASRITRQVYLNELLDDFELNPDTGKMDISVIKNYQGIVEQAINEQMTANQEISGVSAFVDPDQDVQSADEIKTEINIVKRGRAGNITATVSYSLSLTE